MKVKHFLKEGVKEAYEEISDSDDHASFTSSLSELESLDWSIEENECGRERESLSEEDQLEVRRSLSKERSNSQTFLEEGTSEDVPPPAQFKEFYFTLPNRPRRESKTPKKEAEEANVQEKLPPRKTSEQSKIFDSIEETVAEEVAKGENERTTRRLHLSYLTPSHKLLYIAEHELRGLKLKGVQKNYGQLSILVSKPTSEVDNKDYSDKLPQAPFPRVCQAFCVSKIWSLGKPFLKNDGKTVECGFPIP